ncbi:MAG: nitroreductase family protein [Spirochaetia bacterium]|jgi:nitroreductase|nr:nitroreductase family protein [Spirochaetia bacterium]
MDFFKVISERESIRAYDPDNKIEDKVIKKILEAGRIAPSAANRQPWKFIVVSSEAMLEKVRKCYSREWLHSAPHILIVKGKRDKAWTRKYDKYNSLETDLTIAMDHMILAAENEGVGTCWIAAFEPDVLKKALNLDDDEFVFAITPLGYTPEGFSKSGSKIRKPLEEVAEFI